jgi:hypothetical protein
MKLTGVSIASLLILGAVGVAIAPAHASQETVRFESATLIVEVNGTDGDAGLQFFLDSDDAWRSIQIQAPDGHLLVSIDNKGDLRNFGLTELFSESNEPPFDEEPLAIFLQRFPAGDYPFSGTTIDGARLAGTARLTHRIPNGPIVDVPQDGAILDPANAVIQWHASAQPPGVVITGYEVIVERADEKRTFDVHVDSERTSLTVSPEFLEPATDYNVEVLAIETGGNQTITQVSFTTS